VYKPFAPFITIYNSGARSISLAVCRFSRCWTAGVVGRGDPDTYIIEQLEKPVVLISYAHYSDDVRAGRGRIKRPE